MISNYCGIRKISKILELKKERIVENKFFETLF